MGKLSTFAAGVVLFAACGGRSLSDGDDDQGGGGNAQSGRGSTAGKGGSAGVSGTGGSGGITFAGSGGITFAGSGGTATASGGMSGGSPPAAGTGTLPSGGSAGMAGSGVAGSAGAPAACPPLTPTTESCETGLVCNYLTDVAGCLCVPSLYYCVQVDPNCPSLLPDEIPGAGGAADKSDGACLTPDCKSEVVIPAYWECTCTSNGWQCMTVYAGGL